jgi:predicted metal-dependent hydrolase
VQIELAGIPIEVVRKDIRNLHLSVLPPLGRARIAAPRQMPQEAIRAFAISKLAWIRRQQGRLQSQERETPRIYRDRESHYLWGRRYLLRREEREAAPEVKLNRGRLLLQVRPGTDAARCHDILDAWYRARIRAVLPELLTKWESLLGVRSQRVIVQRMKTKWGGCNPASGIIRVNTELARKPPECLEYILVHELTHLLEPTHNERFVALMDHFLPHWRELRNRLNQLPVRHEDWAY